VWPFGVASRNRDAQGRVQFGPCESSVGLNAAGGTAQQQVHAVHLEERHDETQEGKEVSWIVSSCPSRHRHKLRPQDWSGQRGAELGRQMVRQTEVGVQALQRTAASCLRSPSSRRRENHAAGLGLSAGGAKTPAGTNPWREFGGVHGRRAPKVRPAGQFDSDPLLDGLAAAETSSTPRRASRLR